MVVLRLGVERPGTGRRAEAVLDAAVVALDLGAVAIDRHPADRINRQVGRQTTGQGPLDDRIYTHRIPDVLEALLAGVAKLALRQIIQRRKPGCLGHENLAGDRSPGDPRGQVHGGAEPIRPARDRRTGVHSHAYAGKAVLSTDLGREVAGQQYALGGVGGAKHQGVADSLDLGGIVGVQHRTGLAHEVIDQVRRPLVAMGFGQRGEPGEVCEKEGLRSGRTHALDDDLLRYDLPPTFCRSPLHMAAGASMSTSAKNWDNHVVEAEEVARRAGFQDLCVRIIERAQLQPGDVVADIGAGTDLLSLPVAQRTTSVWAIDIAPAMRDYLRAKAASAGVENINAVVASAVSLPLVDESVDLVVSNYCFHHLKDPDKAEALREAARVLRPGGRLVFGDMMFRPSLNDPRDRRVASSKVKAMIRMGPAGLLRLAKNGARFATARWEKPARPQWWEQALVDHGFVDVSVQTLPHEGGIASARKPA